MENPIAFRTNPEKAMMKVSIGSAMIGVLFFVLTFILTFGYKNFNFLAIVQLVLAVPLLYVSTLAHAKIAYWKETMLWDIYGWLAGNIGNTIILNAIGLMIGNISKNLAFAYFGLLVVLMFGYSWINIVYNRKSLNQKILKFIFFLAIIFFGGILPFLLK